ncbi:hypothetical protein [Haloarcula sp. CGMCC 1.2071]|uniref:hypothetical protein n=1 Tax=Haloarcula sp. CGMCC 1.2071 TaxID=3111454 RepID=UPI00300EE626
MSLLSGLRGGSDVGFDSYGTFVPEHNPDPGPFLSETAVLTGTDHAAFHRLTMDLFDERGVYDMTFGYNLARLNLDHRHPDAGFRYGRETDDRSVLRAEFTPTTEFCPQSDTLTVGAFRAWNGLADRHEYDLVRVRVSPGHHQSTGINDKLQQLETRYRKTGDLRTDDAEESSDESVPF